MQISKIDILDVKKPRFGVDSYASSIRFLAMLK